MSDELGEEFRDYGKNKGKRKLNIRQLNAITYNKIQYEDEQAGKVVHNRCCVDLSIRREQEQGGTGEGIAINNNPFIELESEFVPAMEISVRAESIQLLYAKYRTYTYRPVRTTTYQCCKAQTDLTCRRTERLYSCFA